MSFPSCFHSALMPVSRATLPHLAVSSFMKCSKAVRDMGMGSAPSLAKRFFISGSARAALASLFNSSITAPGVPAGASKPHQLLTSTSTPVSLSVWTSGIDEQQRTRLAGEAEEALRRQWPREDQEELGKAALDYGYELKGSLSLGPIINETTRFK